MSLGSSTTVEHIPTEVWQQIFSYLPAKQLIKIRQVCSLWREIVPGSNSFWRTHCKRDFSDVYNTAYLKARIGTQWFNIYRSLMLWSQLAHAKEIRNEFAVVGYSDGNNINCMHVVADGVVGVHKKKYEIIYYDIETMKPIRSCTLRLNDCIRYWRSYEENQHIILMLSLGSLFVIFKSVNNPNYEVNATFCGVQFFLLVNEEIFYVAQDVFVYNYKLFDGKVKTTKLTQSNEVIMCLGYTDQLHYLTFQGNIYSLVNGNVTNIKNSRNILDNLLKYNLLEAVGWKAVRDWYKSRNILPVDQQRLLKQISQVKVYGKVVLVCCGLLFYIYYDPFINGELDIFNSQPVKKYKFDPKNGQIHKTDALETVDGNTVLVATDKKIIALNFIHPES